MRHALTAVALALAVPSYTSASVALSRPAGDTTCSFIHAASQPLTNATGADAASPAAVDYYTWRLASGGAHDAGFSAPFFRVDVAGNAAQPDDGAGSGTHEQAGGEPSRFFYQVCHDALALIPSSPPPACSVAPPPASQGPPRNDACPAACIPPQSGAEPRVCGNGCSALVVLPPLTPGATDVMSRCAALGDKPPVVSLLDETDPGAGLRLTFQAATVASGGNTTGISGGGGVVDNAWACPGGRRTFTLDLLCPFTRAQHGTGPDPEAVSRAAPMPVTITAEGEVTSGLACAFAAVIRHPAACPTLSARNPSAAPETFAATDGDAATQQRSGSASTIQPSSDLVAPTLQWERTRRRIERHVGADEQYDHFELKVSNAAAMPSSPAEQFVAEPLRCGFFAVSPYARFVRFNPPAVTLRPGQSMLLDIRLPSRYLAVPYSETGNDGSSSASGYHEMSVSLQCNGATAPGSSGGAASGVDGQGGTLIRLAREEWPSPGGGTGSPEDVRAAQTAAAHRLVVVVLLLALFSLCVKHNNMSPRYRRPDCRPFCEGDGLMCDDDGEGGITGRRSGYRIEARRDTPPPLPKVDETDCDTAFAQALLDAQAASLADVAAAHLQGSTHTDAVPTESACVAMPAETVSADEQAQVQAAAAAPTEPAPTLPACAVCLAAPRDTVLLPCRHVATCGPCTRRMQIEARTQAPGGVMSCPVCRSPSTGHFTLFVS